MALITCPDCNAQMSTKAGACPRCGRARRESIASRGLKFVLMVLLIVGALILAWIFVRGAQGRLL